MPPLSSTSHLVNLPAERTALSFPTTLTISIRIFAAQDSMSFPYTVIFTLLYFYL